MAESTLNAAFNDLQGDVGSYLGYGRGAANGDRVWTDQQQRSITQCVRGGLRKFYFAGYDWSFLRPVLELTLAEDASTVDLPDDFGGIDGRISLGTGTSDQWFSVEQVNEGTVRERFAMYPDQTGQPEMAAAQPLKGTTVQESNRQQLYVFPTADQEYTLRFASFILPDYLTGSRPYAYGGAQHAETLLSACKATAEIDLDDVKDGPQMQEFQRLLHISMDIDRRLKAQRFGYNGSPERAGRRPLHGWQDSFVTFEGTLY